MSKSNFKIESPNGTFSISVVVSNSALFLYTNFPTNQYPELFTELKQHPYIIDAFQSIDLSPKNKDGYIAVIKDNYDSEIFNDDLETLMDLFLNENPQAIPTGN
jgi:hypothetical protein